MATDTESMTDPSYRGQILVFTTPMIGNYGVPKNTTRVNSTDVGVVLESLRVQPTPVVVSGLAEECSHHLVVESLHDWCLRNGVPDITDVDTRAITPILHDHGTTLTWLAVGADADAPAGEYWDPTGENLVAQVSIKKPYTLNPLGDVRIAVLDFGAKANILRSLIRRGAVCTVLPWNYDLNSVRDQYDGLFLSNGPGDPAHCMEAALMLRKTFDEWNKPIFGICMGHQVIGIAVGLEAYRMTLGTTSQCLRSHPLEALRQGGST